MTKPEKKGWKGRLSSGLISGLMVILAGVAAGGALLQSAMAADKPVTLNVYNWNDYIGENTLRDFTRETGIRIRYDVYDSLELLEQKLLAGKSRYDIAVPTAEPSLSRLIQAGALMKLDRGQIPNLANLDPQLMRALEASDPGNQYAAIYLWGTVGLGMLPDKVKAALPDAPLDSWDLLFKPENAAQLKSCGITIMDSAIDVIPTVLNYLGLDPNSENPEDLARVEQTLMAIRPYVRNFVTGQTITNLAAGDTCLAMGYSGDVLQARDRALEGKSRKRTVDYVSPKEGVQLWFDTLVIPSASANPEAAHIFINYLLRPDVMAGITNAVHYANAVPGSLPLVAENVRKDTDVFPSAEAISRMFTVRAIRPEVERARTRIWTRIKTGK